jgi:hypothetical protein
MNLTAVASLLLLVTSTASASGGQSRPCSNATIKGEYGYAAEGVLIDNPGLPSEAPFRSVGMAHFDGKGNLKWMEHTVVNGIPLNPGIEWTAASGTYTVNPNCTGTAVVSTPNSPVPLNLAFVAVRHGNEVHTLLDAHAIAAVFTKVADSDEGDH